MSTRIQRALDEELARDSLRPEEAAELSAWEEAIDTALAHIRHEPAPDVAAHVMQRIRALEAAEGGASSTPAQPHAERAKNDRSHAQGAGGAWQRAMAWFFAPRPLTVIFRPASALAAAAVVGLLLAAPWAGREAVEAPPPAAAVDGPAHVRGATRVFVQFRLQAPGARRVELAGDFTGWQPAYALSEAAPGVWTVVVPLEPGVHQYAFVIDGERWVADPLAPSVDDGFGGDNSRVDVLPPLAGGAL